MKRITTNIVNDAKKILGMWEKASKETGATMDKEFHIRETASILWVEYEKLLKKL